MHDSSNHEGLLLQFAIPSFCFFAMIIFDLRLWCFLKLKLFFSSSMQWNRELILSLDGYYVMPSKCIIGLLLYWLHDFYSRGLGCKFRDLNKCYTKFIFYLIKFLNNPTFSGWY